MTKAKKEITKILIETGIKMLNIAQELNEKDELFSTEVKTKSKKRGVKNVSTKVSKTKSKKYNNNSD